MAASQISRHYCLFSKLTHTTPILPVERTAASQISRHYCLFSKLTHTTPVLPLRQVQVLCLNSKGKNCRNQYDVKPICRMISLSRSVSYDIKVVPRTVNVSDLKPDALEIFQSAIQAVHPQSMIGNVLCYDEATSTIQVQDKTYALNKNVFVVGMGKAVTGMAKVVEEILGKHIVAGIISIPAGMRDHSVQDEHSSQVLLKRKSKIQVYEGSSANEINDVSFNAAKAIHSLISKLTEKDLLIVLCTGGGSTLCPFPRDPITLEELSLTQQLLIQNGAPIAEINTIRKNIEVLKGGGLALEAKPAKVLSLILSSFLGDPMELIASGPTCPYQPTPRHCIEILTRLNILDQIPENVRKVLERGVTAEVAKQSQKVPDSILAKEELESSWSGIQNIVVGNNSIGCEAAAARASELGYLPLIITTKLEGEARHIGTVHAKLAKFIMMCYDRKLSMESNTDLVKLELDLVRGGMKKEWLNNIINSVEAAYNLNKDVCLISGGELYVDVKGMGIGGKNLETALAAANHMQELFHKQEMPAAETHVCFLSCDSDGYDGYTKVAGAMVDQEFLYKVEQSGLKMYDYLTDNDSYGLMKQIDDGKFMVTTDLTGTNIMDLVVLLVQMPRDRKYVWES